MLNLDLGGLDRISHADYDQSRYFETDLFIYLYIYLCNNFGFFYLFIIIFLWIWLKEWHGVHEELIEVHNQGIIIVGARRTTPNVAASWRGRARGMHEVRQPVFRAVAILPDLY